MIHLKTTSFWWCRVNFLGRIEEAGFRLNDTSFVVVIFYVVLSCGLNRQFKDFANVSGKSVTETCLLISFSYSFTLTTCVSLHFFEQFFLLRRYRALEVHAAIAIDKPIKICHIKVEHVESWRLCEVFLSWLGNITTEWSLFLFPSWCQHAHRLPTVVLNRSLVYAQVSQELHILGILYLGRKAAKANQLLKIIAVSSVTEVPRGLTTTRSTDAFSGNLWGLLSAITYTCLRRLKAALGRTQKEKKTPRRWAQYARNGHFPIWPVVLSE